MHLASTDSATSPIRRTPLGLELDLTILNRLNEPGMSLPEYADELFRFESDSYARLLLYLSKRRPRTVTRILSGSSVGLFVPETDPPPMQVSSPGASAYFNLGELVRPIFIGDRPEFPFKQHQLAGVKWLNGRSEGVLADDMGLGKTLQAIAAIETKQHSGEIHNALVLCPKSLIGVWVAEIQLWAPRLCVIALHSTIPTHDWEKVSNQCHVAITNYEAIRHSTPKAGRFDLVVYDEIHRLKKGLPK